jgi:YD repeat-containing protein
VFGNEAQAVFREVKRVERRLCTGATTNTLTDTSRPEATTDYFKDHWIIITSGTGEGQRKRVTAYNGATDTFTVDSNWTTTPDTGSRYVLLPDGLLTNYAYDAAGQVKDVRDPRGIITRTTYDALGRTTKTIEAYIDGVPSDADDRTTVYTYSGNGDVLTMTADMPSTADDQTTAYVYGVTTGSGSDFNSNDLLKEVKYPDKSNGAASDSEKELFTYNAVGQRKTYLDRNGTKHTYSFDVLGRLTTDNVTGDLGTGVSTAVQKLGYSFDSAGRPYQFTSYDGSGAVVNQVQREYNGLGQLIKESQGHTSSGASGAPNAQYAYSAVDANNRSRPTSITYPNGRVVSYNYPSGLDSYISRLSSVTDTSGDLES